MIGLSIGPPGFVGPSHLSVFNSPAEPTSLYHPQPAQATSFYQQQHAQSHLAHLQQVHATVLPPSQPAQHVIDSATVAQDLASGAWNMDTDASSHLNNSNNSLSEIFSTLLNTLGGKIEDDAGPRIPAVDRGWTGLPCWAVETAKLRTGPERTIGLIAL
ncbi:hypothetical protein Tco_0710689 [Tanacetum coccineum]